MQADLPFPAPGPGVPGRYRGIWRRSLLETGDGRDTSTTVFWLQAAGWHADIRIPASRPDFTGVDSVAGCRDTHLAWLATQQGFAGVTDVRRLAHGELCSWQRIIDYQPPQHQPDAAWMRFEPERLVETGAHARYLEHWHPLADTSARMAVLRAVDTAQAHGASAELLFLAGAYVMHLRWPRDASCAPAGAWFDLEISFGKRSADGIAITHSTMPWMEGKDRPLRMLAQDGRFAEIDCDGRRRTWRILECTGPEVWG